MHAVLPRPPPDNLFVTNQNGFYGHSQTSLDRAQVELGGRVRNGSVYSAHSTSSLNSPQPYLQPSPGSSNPSITGSDVLRPDYVPSHRHSALIPPSYRPTPDYETVMKQLQRGLAPAERQSRSLRNLSLVYSQPEIREHARPGSPPMAPCAFSLSHSFHSPAPYPYASAAGRRPGLGAVSVPELTNAQLQARDCPAPSILRTQVYRPPPPYPHPRPANSTPDLSRQPPISSSNPDLITRRVHHSVQTFQEDSLPVAHSLQEVSEPLTAARRARLQKRNSVELAGLAHGLEGLRLQERAAPALAAGERALRAEDCAAGLRGSLRGGHGKSLSDATVLIHSSDEDEDEDPEEGPAPPLGSRGGRPPDASHAAPLAPGPLHILEPQAPGAAPGEGPRPRRDGLLSPSASESDLTTSGRYRARRDSLQKRPASDLLSAKKNAVEGLPPLGVSRGPCGVGAGASPHSVVPPANLPFSAPSALCPSCL